MVNRLHVQIYADLIRRRGRVFRDREHRDVYDDVDFRSRYRLRCATVMNIIDGLRDDIQLGHDGRNGIWPLLSSLCFKIYSGSVQTVYGDLHGVNTSATHFQGHRQAKRRLYPFSKKRKHTANWRFFYNWSFFTRNRWQWLHTYPHIHISSLTHLMVLGSWTGRDFIQRNTSSHP